MGNEMKWTYILAYDGGFQESRTVIHPIFAIFCWQKWFGAPKNVEKHLGETNIGESLLNRKTVVGRKNPNPPSRLEHLQFWKWKGRWNQKKYTCESTFNHSIISNNYIHQNPTFFEHVVYMFKKCGFLIYALVIKHGLLENLPLKWNDDLQWPFNDHVSDKPI